MSLLLLLLLACSCFLRYGVGMIYYKQEKFALADMHFRKALSINPQSSVLLCHIGVVSVRISQNIQTWQQKQQHEVGKSKVLSGK